MTYEIDQSNKIESSGDTVLALSNEKEYTMYIPAREKQAAIATLRWHPSLLLPANHLDQSALHCHAMIWDMWLVCHTQKEIAEAVGSHDNMVANVIATHKN